jgi:hypothetical protein
MTGQRFSKPDAPAGRLQYSLRSLLALTTLACLVLSILRYASFPAWGSGVMALLAWSGLLAGQGGAALAAGWRGQGRADVFGRGMRRRAAAYLAAAGAVAPLVTFLLFAVALCGADFRLDRLAGRVDPYAESQWRGGTSVWPVLFVLNPLSVVASAISCPFYFRIREDFALLLVRALGVLSALAATWATLAIDAAM